MGNVEDEFEVLIHVITDIGIGSPVGQDVVPLFPYPDGMGFYP